MNLDLLHQVLTETPDAVTAISGEGTVLLWNRAAEQIFGYTEKEALGFSFNELVVPSNVAAEENRAREEALKKGLSVYESVRRRKDGSLVHVSVSVKAVR